MKLHVRTLVDSVQALGYLSTLDIDVMKAYNLAKLNKNVDAILEPVNKTREALIRKHGEEDPTGRVQVKPENVQKFTEEYTQILDEEVELEFPEGFDVKIEDLKGLKGSDNKIKPAHLTALDWLF